MLTVDGSQRTVRSVTKVKRSQLAKIKAATGLDFCLHDLRRTFATHAQAQGMDCELIRRALNHSSGGGVTSQYIITQVETLIKILIQRCH
jgi:integrase